MLAQRALRLTAVLAGLIGAGGDIPGAAAGDGASQLEPVVRSDLVFNGVAATKDSRLFLPFQRQEKDKGIEVAEIVGGKPKAYPDETWNSWVTGKDAANAFVGVNALRIGPDGDLWVVDRGVTGLGETPVAGGPKVVQIDVKANKVRRVYSLQSAAGGKSFVDDIRFNGRRAYLTDAGRPGLIVLDLDSGATRRLLEFDSSTTASRPLLAEGKELSDPHGKPVVVNADQLEVSPDGKMLYFQPCSGPMYRIDTAFLDDPAAKDLPAHVKFFTGTPSTGGTAMDADGNLYSSDTDKSQILKVTPDGKVTTLIRDPRLVWVDAMWIDDQGNLLLPAAQLNRTAAFNAGKSTIQFPTVVYKLAIGAKPLRR